MNNYLNTDYLKISDYQNPPGQGLPLVPYSVVSPEYFATMRIPILRGRSFTEADATGAPYAAVVSQAFAARYWPKRDPIGKRFAKVSGITNPVYEVVGVAKDCHFSDLTTPIDPYFYLPLAQDYALSSLQILEIRSATPPDVVIRETQDVARSLAANLPLFDIHTMTESLDTLQGFLLFRLAAGFAAALGLLGLILAIVGVYGVISYSVSQRTHEIGIRMALGARRAEVLKMILRQGFVIVAAGLALGWLSAFAAARLIANLLVGDLLGRYPYTGSRRARGLLHPGAPRDVRRSHGRAEIRVARPESMASNAAAAQFRYASCQFVSGIPHLSVLRPFRKRQLKPEASSASQP